ncbi:MAG: tRNA (N6-threonylcarbamoyladenosine(37)-N6)-methyltransferase TrmO [Bacteroidales bacterium]|nr:tRNA (N6-threonylcarbamoyladenosine(37)-N6)-methyltransferase TrmO [Bacteroidales bacterium]
MNDIIRFKPIGTIYTPFNELTDMPIQSIAAKNVKGYIQLHREYLEGLCYLSGFSHITLLYHFHKSNGYKLKVKPFVDNTERGIFATRAPLRPNAIGISTVKLLFIEDDILHIESVDMLNETPLIDIKPFYAGFDNRNNTKSGWLDDIEDIENINLRSDNRFVNR